jgi:hypothetical protein
MVQSCNKLLSRSGTQVADSSSRKHFGEGQDQIRQWGTPIDNVVRRQKSYVYSVCCIARLLWDQRRSGVFDFASEHWSSFGRREDI